MVIEAPTVGMSGLQVDMLPTCSGFCASCLACRIMMQPGHSSTIDYQRHSYSRSFFWFAFTTLPSWVSTVFIIIALKVQLLGGVQKPAQISGSDCTGLTYTYIHIMLETWALYIHIYRLYRKPARIMGFVVEGKIKRRSSCAVSEGF